LRITYPDVDFPDPDEIAEPDPGEQEEAIDIFWTKRFYTGGAKVDDSDQEEEESARKARLDSMIADVDEAMAKVKRDSPTFADCGARYSYHCKSGSSERWSPKAK
jgi:hypothetical protein